MGDFWFCGENFGWNNQSVFIPEIALVTFRFQGTFEIVPTCTILRTGRDGEIY